jgi:D-alanyl-D-alanine carboxypeptidase
VFPSTGFITSILCYPIFQEDLMNGFGFKSLPGQRHVRFRKTAAFGALAASVGGLAGLLAPAAHAAPATSMSIESSATPAHRTTPLQDAANKLVADGMPGVVILVRNGSTITTTAAGEADLATHRAMTARDHVRVGSVTKMFTSTMVLQLAAEHRISLRDSVERWLPGLVPNGRAITVRQLLNHTSGLFDYIGDADLMAPYMNSDGTLQPSQHYVSPRELVTAATKHAPLFSPGQSWSYSNTNYILLGLVIEAATHHSFTSELEHRIIKPLGLHDTALPTRSVKVQDPAAHGYELYGKAGGPSDLTEMSPSWAWAAGGVTSTVGDTARFEAALLAGRLLPQKELNQMKEMLATQDAAIPRYGLGLMEVDMCGHKLFGHGGDVPGYHSNALSTADARTQIVMITNSGLDTFTKDMATDWSAAAKVALCPSGTR